MSCSSSTMSTRCLVMPTPATTLLARRFRGRVGAVKCGLTAGALMLFWRHVARLSTGPRLCGPWSFGDAGDDGDGARRGAGERAVHVVLPQLHNILEGNWQSCREADGRYSERVYDHVVNGVGQFEVHMGPRTRVRDLQGRAGRAPRSRVAGEPAASRTGSTSKATSPATSGRSRRSTWSSPRRSPAGRAATARAGSSCSRRSANPRTEAAREFTSRDRFGTRCYILSCGQ